MLIEAIPTGTKEAAKGTADALLHNGLQCDGGWQDQRRPSKFMLSCLSNKPPETTKHPNCNPVKSKQCAKFLHQLG